MILEFFARGLIIGFAIAAPVGPIGLLVIRRTLSDGRLLGLLTGLGAATADALYGCVGAFSLTFVSSALIGYSFWTRLVGGLFLCWLGIKTFRAKPDSEAPPASTAKAAGAYLSTLLLTLANPATILSFAAVFAGFGLGTNGVDYSAATTIVAGVFIGSALWWLLLSGGVSLLRHRLSNAAMGWINRSAGILLFTFGAVALLSLLTRHGQ